MRCLSKWIVSLLMLLSVAASSQVFGATITVGDANARKVKEQQAENKKWKNEAESLEGDYWNKAEQYYAESQWGKAAEYYRKLVNLRYKQWKFRQAGDTILSAMETEWCSLDSNRARRAQARLASMSDRIQAEKESEAKKKITALTDKADVAMMLGDTARAYDLYAELITLTNSLGDTKLSVSNRIMAQNKQKEIIATLAKPLDEAEKLLKENKSAEAKVILDEFPAKAGTMLTAIEPLKERYNRMIASEAILRVSRDEEVKRRLLAGDAAMVRRDYVGAENHYRTAAAMHPDTAPAQEAAKKLAALLADPAIAEAIKQQVVERECRPLLARARYLVNTNEIEAARTTCQGIIAKYPDSPWAKEAQAILDELPS